MSMDDKAMLRRISNIKSREKLLSLMEVSLGDELKGLKLLQHEQQLLS